MTRLDWINLAITFGGVFLSGVGAYLWVMHSARVRRREREAEASRVH